MSAPALSPAPHPLVVQHNTLVNARLELSTVEMRLFVSLLSRIGRHDTAFAECRVPVREIMGVSVSQTMYEQVHKALHDFASRTLTIKLVEEHKKRPARPDFVVLPLMAYAKYQQGEGLVEAQFNERLIPYLLELRDNFTKAQLVELLKLKSASSYRIYWLLCEYSAFGKRTISLAELKSILGLEKEYDRFDNFKARVLDRAQQELARTDLPFEYELLRQGKAVKDIRFLFGPKPVPLPAPDLTGWEAALLAVGVAPQSLDSIRAQLAAGQYDEGYVQYVLHWAREQVRLGKVKKEGGAVYKALVDGYLLRAYQKLLAVPAVPLVAAKRKSQVKFSPREREKLTNELADARNSLRFVTSATTGYSTEQRAQASKEIEAKIVRLMAQLAAMA